MVDAEQQGTHGRYPLWVPDLDALEEKPDPETRDHPDDDIEGAAAIPSSHGGECPSAGSSSRCSFPTRRCHRHTPTASVAARASRTARPSHRSARCTSATMALI